MPASAATFWLFAKALVVSVTAWVRLTPKLWSDRPCLTLSMIGALSRVFVVLLPRSGNTLSAWPSLRRYWTCAFKMTLAPRPPPARPEDRPPPPGPPGSCPAERERFCVKRRLTVSDHECAVVERRQFCVVPGRCD